MNIEIRELDFESFFEAPFSAYGEDSHYVSPLKSDLRNLLDAEKNPLFSSKDDFCFFTAHRHEKILGRILSHVHKASNNRHGLNRAYFGFFDCVDDDEVATALLSAAENWARQKGYDEITGNFNMTIAQQIGVMTDGFEKPPFIDMMYNPEHIPRQLEKNGYMPFFPMTTSGASLSVLSYDKLNGDRQQEIFNNSDFTWKEINRRTLNERLAEARILLNDAFNANPMFVPLTAEEFVFQTASLASIIDPRISQIVYYKGKPAGVIICIPDANPLLKSIRSTLGISALFKFIKYKFTCKRAVIIYYAVTTSLHGQGINSAMMCRVVESLKKAGYTEVGGTWIADSNAASLRIREKMNISVYHHLHLFRKAL